MKVTGRFVGNVLARLGWLCRFAILMTFKEARGYGSELLQIEASSTVSKQARKSA